MTDLRRGAIEHKIRPALDERAATFVPKWDETIEMAPELEDAIFASASMDVPLLVVGPTGCGKTRTILNVAAALNQPVRRFNLFGDVRSADLLGEKSLEPDPETGESIIVWRDGVVTDCKRNGYWLILDELDACPPNVAFTLQSLLEPGHPLLLPGNAGELVEQEVEGPGLRIFATANTLGRGDASGIYTGTTVLNEAFLDRFIVAKASYLGAEAEAQVLVTHGADARMAGKVVELAKIVRAGFDRSDTLSTLSTRRLVAWTRLAVTLGAGTPAEAHWRAAYGLAVANKLAEDEAKFFGGIVQRVFGWPQ